MKKRNKIPLKFIDIYQNSKSPNSPPKCKYMPTCSNYAKEAYQKFNFFKASWLTFYRLIRCNPFSRGGYNPVPLTREERRKLKMEKSECEK